MTYTTPTVNYSATINGTYTSLTGIQSVSINRGRQRFQDNFTQTTCVIELIPANSYALPLAVGQFIDVRNANTSSSPCYFVGEITDVSRRYEMPYNAGTGAAPADRITITATGPVGLIGANSIDTTFVADTAIMTAARVADFAGVEAYRSAFTSASTSAITFNGGALDLMNGVLRTGQLFIDDLDTKRAKTFFNLDSAIQLFNPGLGSASYVFSDSGTVGAFKFAALEYLSSVQNVFTEVDVVSPGIATQSASTGSRPFNTLIYNAYTNSVASSLDLATYVLNIQNQANITPFMIATDTLLSPTCTTLGLINVYESGGFVANPGANLGSPVTVQFRGTSVLAQIQGINTVFYPDQARVQLYLSPSLGAPFTLDSASFGVLDQNKLGY